MKKLMLMLSVLLAMSACTLKSPVAGVADDNADSLIIQIDSMAVAMTLKLDAPPADTLLARCLAQFVGRTMFFADADDEPAVAPVYEGNLRAYLDSCARQKWNELRDATFGTADETDGAADADGETLSPEEMAAEAVAEQMALTAYEMVYAKVYETDSLVTWACHYDFFVYNTAHPSFGGFGQTFSKADGHPLGHELLQDTDSPGFKQLLKEALRRWLADEFGEQADTDAQLKEYLFNPHADPDALPLPEQAPYLTTEGVVLSYAENELTFSREPARLVIPFESVRPFLTQAGR